MSHPNCVQLVKFMRCFMVFNSSNQTSGSFWARFHIRSQYPSVRSAKIQQGKNVLPLGHFLFLATVFTSYIIYYLYMYVCNVYFYIYIIYMIYIYLLIYIFYIISSWVISFPTCLSFFLERSHSNSFFLTTHHFFLLWPLLNNCCFNSTSYTKFKISLLRGSN